MRALRIEALRADGYRSSARRLAGLLLLIGFMGLGYALWPPAPSPHRAVEFTIGVVLFFGAIVLLVLPGLAVRPLTLHSLLALAWMSAAVTAALRVVPASQVLWGFPIVLAASFAAYHLGPRATVVHVVGMSVAYAAATILINPLNGPLFVVVVLATVLSSTGAVAQMRHSREAAEAALTDAAITDPLTGVLNRRGLDMLSHGLHAAASRAGQPTTVVVIDLDDFKGFNDTHGHAAGDELLLKAARRWRRCLREGDLLARIGGDEFALVLPNADDPDAVLKRMQGRGVGSWSSGHSLWLDGDDVWEALSRADAVMYEEKRSRRGGSA